MAITNLSEAGYLIKISPDKGVHKIYRGASKAPNSVEYQEVNGMIRYLQTTRKWTLMNGRKCHWAEINEEK